MNIHKIEEAIWKTSIIPTENLRASKAKTDGNNLGFVTTFKPSNIYVFPLIETAFKWLQQLVDIKLIKNQSQPFSLKKLFTRAKHSNKKDNYSKKRIKPQRDCFD